MMALIDFLEDLAFDGNLIELSVWYPHLGWREVVLWIAALVIWRIAFERVERTVAFHTRRALSRNLARLAVITRPMA